MKKKKNSPLSDILGSVLNGFVSLIIGIPRLIVKLTVAFGLWFPASYALIGVILYYAASFNPFDFDVYGVLYLSGGVACLVCTIIISVRNIIVKPVRSAMDRKHTARNEEHEETERLSELREKRRKKDEEETLVVAPVFEEPPKKKKKPPEKTPEYLVTDSDYAAKREEAERMLFDVLPVKRVVEEPPKVEEAPKKEIPELYFSSLQPNILVHEYKDRFELFKVVGNRTVSIGVEYK